MVISVFQLCTNELLLSLNRHESQVNLSERLNDLMFFPFLQPVLDGGTAGLGSGDGDKDRAHHSISATAIALLHNDPVSDLITEHSPFLPLCFHVFIRSKELLPTSTFHKPKTQASPPQTALMVFLC